MEHMPPARRTQGRRATAASFDTQVRKKKKTNKSVLLALCVFAALVLLIVAISPKEPISRAVYTTATGDGHVEGSITTASMYEGLVISELMPSNRSAVPDETGEYHDWVEVWNSSDRPIDIEHVGLSDRSDSIRFLFPDIVLEPGERVIVYCSDTNAAEVGHPLHAKFKISSVGETVYLFDPSGYMLCEATNPILSSDESWALMPDGTWAVTKLYSPGYENTEAGFQAYRDNTMVVEGALVINEIMADPLTGIRDEDGELVDWIELRNTTDRTISLAGYVLSDKENKPLKWHFPEGAVVAPHGYYVVFCSGKDRADNPAAVPHANFSISAERETIVLSDSYGRLVDRVTIDNLPEDCSYARNEDGTFSVQPIATPSLPNSETGVQRMDENLRAMNQTGVIISEVMLSNESTLVYTGAGYVDWVEIYNSSPSTVDLSGFGLSDNIGRARKWQFPQGTVIAPGEYKIILCDGQAELTTSAQLHTSFSLNRVEEGVVCLSTPDGTVLDKLVLPEVPTNVSYGRTLGLAGFFYYDQPTPMSVNGLGFYGYAQAPTFTVEPGLYYETVNVAFNVPQDTQVFYTTDGSIPTQQSTPYTGETLELSRVTVLRARAFSTTGLRPSTILTGSYFINTYHTLPIVSLVADPDALWNPETGMLTIGEDIVKPGPGLLPWKNSVYRRVKEELDPKEGHVEFYLLDGTRMLSQGMEFSLQGQFSLDMPQKSFKLRAKSLYGQSTFPAKLFEDRPYTEYKSFVLRNSGNDSAWTRLLDGFQSRILDDYGSQVIHQAWNPVVVYVNGVYWGHMNMRERVDRFFVAQHEGLPMEEADKMDIIEASGTTKYGTNKGYKAMIAKIKEGDPAKNPEDLQYILDNVDVENYFEYIAFEMFFGNSDIGNLRAYRLHREGSKWRWILYDVDYGLFSSSFDSPASYTKAKGMGDKRIDNTILLKLLTVPEYKDLFLRTLAKIFNTYTTDKMLSILEPMVKQIEPEMNMHFFRWAEEHDQMIISEWPNTPDGAYRYWQQRVERLRNTVRCRPTRLWEYIKNAFGLTQSEMVAYFGEQPPFPPDAKP